MLGGHLGSRPPSPCLNFAWLNHSHTGSRCLHSEGLGEGTHFEEVSEQVVTLILAGHKYKDLALLIPLAQDFQQAKKSVLHWSDLHTLADIAVDHAAAAHLDLNGRYKHCPRERLHLQIHQSIEGLLDLT